MNCNGCGDVLEDGTSLFGADAGFRGLFGDIRDSYSIQDMENCRDTLRKLSLRLLSFM